MSHPAPSQLLTLGAISLGGTIGALGRYGLTLAVASPWSTLVINVAGCLLMGVLMAVLTSMPHPHPLLRPALGVGVLGGFTTFSTYAVDVLALTGATRWAYLLATPVSCVAATAVGVAVTRRCLR